MTAEEERPLQAGDRIRYTGPNTSLAGKLGRVVYVDVGVTVRWDGRGLTLVPARHLQREEPTR